MAISDRIIKLYKLDIITDSKVYKESMDYVRINERMGYHINEWSLEELDKTTKFGLPVPGNLDDLLCGGTVDDDGFMAGAFSSENKRKLHWINDHLLPTLMRATVNDGGGYLVGSFGDYLARIYMDQYHFIPVIKTLVPKEWDANKKMGEKHVYFSVKAPFRSNDPELKFDTLEAKNLIPIIEIDAKDRVEENGEICRISGIDLIKYIGQEIPTIKIPEMIKRGQVKNEADDILKSASKWMKGKELRGKN